MLATSAQRGHHLELVSGEDGSHEATYQHSMRTSPPSRAHTQTMQIGRQAMKIWSDFSMLVKVVVVCLALGFALGLCLAGAFLDPTPGHPSPLRSDMAYALDA